LILWPFGWRLKKSVCFDDCDGIDGCCDGFCGLL
jgi:hypothetical protein